MAPSIDSVAKQIYREYKERVRRARETTKRRAPVIPQLAEENGFYPWMTFRACLQVLYCKTINERSFV